MSKTLQTETADLVNLEMNSWEAARSAVFLFKNVHSITKRGAPTLNKRAEGGQHEQDQ